MTTFCGISAPWSGKNSQSSDIWIASVDFTRRRAKIGWSYFLENFSKFVASVQIISLWSVENWAKRFLNPLLFHRAKTLSTRRVIIAFYLLSRKFFALTHLRTPPPDFFWQTLLMADLSKFWINTSAGVCTQKVEANSQVPSWEAAPESNLLDFVPDLLCIIATH